MPLGYCAEVWDVLAQNCNFLLVLYGCETRCHTVREEHSLKMFENRVQREEDTCDCEG
jgi:hypothetical protein